MLFAFPNLSPAAQTSLAWDPNYPTPDGYHVFKRAEGEKFDYKKPAWPIDGKDNAETTCTIQGLTDGVTYYFVVRAYVKDKISDDSNEVSYETPLVDAPPVVDAPPENRHPVAEAGQHQAITSGKTVYLNGSGSHDPDNDPLTYQWTQTDGPAVALDCRSDQCSFAAPAVGSTETTLSFTLTVADDKGLTHSDTCTVTVASGQQPPTDSPDELKIWLEAEEGDIEWPMIIADDPKASDGGYIYTPIGSIDFVNIPDSSTGYSEHTFELPAPGTYAIWGRVVANNSGTNSFYVAMDDAEYSIWDVPYHGTDIWAWEVMGNYHLQPGVHKLAIATRETGTQIDRILVTDALNYKPSDSGEFTHATTMIPKADWQVVSVDSEELVGEDGAAENAFDDDPYTIWHTEWKNTNPTHPHELIIDLGSTYQMNGFTMLPRNDSVNGRIIDYQFFVSNHPDQWSQPVSSGKFVDDQKEKSVSFNSAVGRYIKLVALSASNNKPWTSLAEIGIKGIQYAYDISPYPPVNPPVKASTRLSKTDWQLVSINSEELVGEDGAAENAFDDDPDTIWHTQWKGTSPTHPHEIVIDLGGACQLDGFSMLPRNNGINGRIIDYQFYVSNDPDQWSQPVAAGKFADNANEKSITFNSTQGRYIKLVALSSTNNGPWTSVAEISVEGVASTD